MILRVSSTVKHCCSRILLQCLQQLIQTPTAKSVGVSHQGIPHARWMMSTRSLEDEMLLSSNSVLHPLQISHLNTLHHVYHSLIQQQDPPFPSTPCFTIPPDPGLPLSIVSPEEDYTTTISNPSAPRSILELTHTSSRKPR